MNHTTTLPLPSSSQTSTLPGPSALHSPTTLVLLIAGQSATLPLHSPGQAATLPPQISPGGSREIHSDSGFNSSIERASETPSSLASETPNIHDRIMADIKTEVKVESSIGYPGKHNSGAPSMVSYMLDAFHI